MAVLADPDNAPFATEVIDALIVVAAECRGERDPIGALCDKLLDLRPHG